MKTEKPLPGVTSYSAFELIFALRKALAVLALPALQFLFLRIFIKQTLGLQFGWKGFTDWDFIFSVPVALAIIFFVLDRARPIALRWNREFLTLNFSGLILFLVCNARYDTLAARSPILTVAVWTLLACGTLLSGLFARVDPLDLLRNPNRWVLVPGLLIALTHVYSQTVLGGVWQPLARWASNDAHFILNHTLGSVEAIATSLHGTRIILKHPEFAISIGRGCGGLDAFVLFFLFLFCLRVFRPTLFKTASWALVAVLGVPVMYLINVLRICSFFFVAIGMRRVWDPGPHEDLALALFHSHAGWIFYVLGILGYLQLFKGSCNLVSETLQNIDARSKSAKMGRMRSIIFFFLTLFSLNLASSFFSNSAYAATCNEACSASSDCDSSCPICIGVCVSCFEIGDSTACGYAESGASTNCQWDGRKCKPLSDAPVMPTRIWPILLFVLLLVTGYFGGRRLRRVAR